MTDPAFKLLADNGCAFLLRAIKDVANRPDVFAVGVYTAIELFLKARLAHEHWSLMVNKAPNRTKFEAGDFVSVTFDEACIRLRDILQDPLPEETRAAFDALRMIRNKIVHFSPPGGDVIGVEAAKLQHTTRTTALEAWALLVDLLRTQWAPSFNELPGLVDEIAQAGHKAENTLKPVRY